MILHAACKYDHDRTMVVHLFMNKDNGNIAIIDVLKLQYL